MRDGIRLTIDEAHGPAPHERATMPELLDEELRIFLGTQHEYVLTSVRDVCVLLSVPFR